MSYIESDLADTLGLIKQDLKQIIGENELVDMINQGHKPHVYWGTSPTGLPHIGYMCAMIKIADLLKVGCRITILLADLHAMLDANKTEEHQLQDRIHVYKMIVCAMLDSLVPNAHNMINFQIGSEFQETQPYTRMLLRATTIVTQTRAKHSGAEVVKQTKDPMMSGLVYPIMQALDEEFIGNGSVDAQLGGFDQVKIMTMARELLPKLGCRARIELMTNMLPSLSQKDTDKMSASSTIGKIDICDNSENIRNKINKVFCADRDLSTPLISLLQLIIIPYFTRHREPLSFKLQEYFSIVDNFKNGKITPQQLKHFVTVSITEIWSNVLVHLPNSAFDSIKRTYPA
jgi:tyrosyl-tRNA synthetase